MPAEAAIYVTLRNGTGTSPAVRPSIRVSTAAVVAAEGAPPTGDASRRPGRNARKTVASSSGLLVAAQTMTRCLESRAERLTTWAASTESIEGASRKKAAPVAATAAPAAAAASRHGGERAQAAIASVIPRTAALINHMKGRREPVMTDPQTVHLEPDLSGDPRAHPVAPEKIPPNPTAAQAQAV